MSTKYAQRRTARPGVPDEALGCACTRSHPSRRHRSQFFTGGFAHHLGLARDAEGLQLIARAMRAALEARTRVAVALERRTIRLPGVPQAIALDLRLL